MVDVTLSRWAGGAAALGYPGIATSPSSASSAAADPSTVELIVAAAAVPSISVVSASTN